MFDINKDLSIIAVSFILLLLETFNALVRIAAVKSDGGKTSTQLALGLIKEMLAIGIGNVGYIIISLRGHV